MRNENKRGGMGVRLRGERKGCVWSCLVCGDVALGEAVQRVVLLAVGSGTEAREICQKRPTNVKKRLTKRKQGDHIVRTVIVLTLGRMMSLHVVCKAPEW